MIQMTCGGLDGAYTFGDVSFHDKTRNSFKFTPSIKAEAVYREVAWIAYGYTK